MEASITQRTRKPRAEPAPKVVPDPIEETKRERFLRIGTARMNRVLDHIRLLGNLSNSNYEWTEQDIRTIQNAIVDELGKTTARFQKAGAKEKAEFSFSEFAE